jgi:hypothetical protein
MQKIVSCILKVTEERSRIRIRTKTSRIPNIAPNLSSLKFKESPVLRLVVALRHTGAVHLTFDQCSGFEIWCFFTEKSFFPDPESQTHISESFFTIFCAQNISFSVNWHRYFSVSVQK